MFIHYTMISDPPSIQNDTQLLSSRFFLSICFSCKRGILFIVINIRVIHPKRGNTDHKVSDKMYRRDLERFENAFPNGVYSEPHDENSPKVKVRALDTYCKANSVRPKDLSEEEMEQFLIRP